MSKIDHIRNFAIIAHIDHGKSTIADRIIHKCGGLTDREMKSQVLDSMDIERERGITIKAQTVKLNYTSNDGKKYILNIIDTPGHVDFSYEVSRSLYACEGSILIVDSTQGVEAQTLANVYQALDINHEIIPVLNKIDLPASDIDKTNKQIEDVIGIDTLNAVPCSGKTGEGINEILEKIIQSLPAPTGKKDKVLKCLLVDSWYDTYLGVVILIRVIDGKISKNMKIKMMSTNQDYIVEKVGIFTPKAKDINELNAGEIGFIITGIKVLSETKVGDTICEANKPLKKALRDIVMATKPSKSDLADSVQIALDAADTATGVTEEFNSIKEQFEVVNIQAKRIHQSVTIIFVSAIAAAVISLAAGFLMYYKSLGTLQTNSNMAIESIAIFTENVSSLDESIKTVETNTKNQESIKETLAELRGAADKASQDIINADTRYNQAIKMSVQDTERLIQDFAENTLSDLKAQSDASQIALSEQILEIQKFFAPKTEQEDGAEAGVEPEDTLVTLKQFQALEKKVDELIMLQKEIATNVLEMNRVRKAQAKKKVSAPKPQPKPKPNPLKFP